MVAGPPPGLGRSAHEDVGVLLFVVARTRQDRYGELRRQFADWRDVRIVVDRRDGDRRTSHPSFAGFNRRREERRRVDIDIDSFGWSVVDTGERWS